jgi:putative addiction module component (TIGR02574 family)
MDVATTLKQIESWPVADQVELMHQVWDRLLDSGWEPTLSEEEKAELDRRLDDLEANPGKVKTWEEVLEHVRRKR